MYNTKDINKQAGICTSANMYDNDHNEDTRLTSIFKTTQVRLYQNGSIVDSIAAKDDGGGGDNWSQTMCKAPAKSSPPTQQQNQYPDAYRPDAIPVAQPTVSRVLIGMVKALKADNHNQKHTI